VDAASILDEHVEPVMGGAEVAGEGADRIDVLQIGQAVADADAAGRRGDAAPGPLCLAAFPAEEVSRRAGPARRRPRDGYGFLPDLAQGCATAQAGGGRVVRTQVAFRCASPPPSGWD
jgi:hypothetical protein